MTDMSKFTEKHPEVQDSRSVNLTHPIHEKGYAMLPPEIKQSLNEAKKEGIPSLQELRKNPIPYRNKIIGRRKWVKFFELLKKLGNPKSAAAGACIPWKAVKDRLASDPEFADQMEEAEGVALAKLEEEAWRRAHDGVIENVFNGKGEKIDERVKYSDKLLLKLLESLDKERYGNAAPSVQVNVGVDQDAFKSRLATLLGVTIEQPSEQQAVEYYNYDADDDEEVVGV